MLVTDALCECGCGMAVPISTRNNKKYGWVKGQPMRFIFGHRARLPHANPRTDETRRKLSEARKGKCVGPDHWNWRGGVTVRDKSRYVQIKVGRDHPMAATNGYVFEHRLVMSAHLGRPLVSAEVVHHINHDRRDNRLENLMLFPSQSEHMKFHRKELEAATCS